MYLARLGYRSVAVHQSAVQLRLRSIAHEVLSDTQVSLMVQPLIVRDSTHVEPTHKFAKYKHPLPQPALEAANAVPLKQR